MTPDTIADTTAPASADMMLMSPGTAWVIGALLLILVAVLALAQAALDAASRGRLRALADRGRMDTRQVLSLTDQPQSYRDALSLLRLSLMVLAITLMMPPLIGHHGWWGLILGTVALTGFILILCRILPRSLARLAPETIATRLWPLARAATRALSPPSTGLSRLASTLLPRPAEHLREDSGRSPSPMEEIAGTLALGQSAGSVAKAERDRLMGALDLGDRWVEEVMLHRSQIQMIDAAAKPYEILQTVIASPFTRLPVYRNERENIIGVIHAKDLLRAVNQAVQTDGARALRNFDALAIAMPPYFVPETTALDEQLHEFLARRTHFALVVDEYGSLRGLITLEDILEEIVGEIEDEHDRAGQALRPNAAGEYVVNGAMTIRDINRALGWHLPDDEANTIAGLVIHIAQSIPVPGQVFSFGELRFEVLSRRDNRITRLRIRPTTLMLAAPQPDRQPVDDDQPLESPQRIGPEHGPVTAEVSPAAPPRDSEMRRITPTAPHIDIDPNP